MRQAPWIAACAFGLLMAREPAPRPLLAWPAGPMEVRVAFDRPIEAASMTGLVGRTIPFGVPEKAGGTSLKETWGHLRIAAIRLEDAGRTLLLMTDPHSKPAAYILTLPDGSGGNTTLSYDLTGAEISWDDGKDDATPGWSGWWPQADIDETRHLVEGSAAQQGSFALLSRPGRLSLRSMIAVPKGKVTIELQSAEILEATLAFEEPSQKSGGGGGDPQQVAWSVESTGDPLPLAATVATGPSAKPFTIRLLYRAESDPAAKVVPRAWQILPWTPPALPAPGDPPPVPFDLAEGDRQRGEAIFYSKEARCADCHAIRGRGGDIGPDLSDLSHRTPAQLHRSIAEPSAEIAPDFLPYTVALKDGRVVVGTVRAHGEHEIQVMNTEGKATLIPRSEVEELRPSSTSIMPVGLAGVLGEQRLRDILTFLRSPPPPQPTGK